MRSIRRKSLSGVPFDSLYRLQVGWPGAEASRSLEKTMLQLEIIGPSRHSSSPASEVRKWEPKLLYLAARSYLRRGIEISDAEVRRMYEKEKKRLQRLFGPHAGFGEMKNELAARLYLEEEAQRVFRTTQRLMKEVPVHVDEQMVQRLARTLGRGVDRVDVIWYKPGGTFPRVAFPTIDPAWQSFH